MTRTLALAAILVTATVATDGAPIDALLASGADGFVGRWLVDHLLDAGDDAFVFFRHDETGRGAELAVALGSRFG